MSEMFEGNISISLLLALFSIRFLGLNFEFEFECFTHMLRRAAIFLCILSLFLIKTYHFSSFPALVAESCIHDSHDESAFDFRSNKRRMKHRQQQSLPDMTSKPLVVKVCIA